MPQVQNLQPPPRPLTILESWYLSAFTLLANHLRRGPTLREFSRYVSRDLHTVHDALRTLVGAGVLVQDVKSGRFELPRSTASKKSLAKR